MDHSDTAGYLRTLEAWRDSMDAAIRKEDGWLALAGLFWLHPGENTFGSAETNDIALPAPSPAHAGVFHLNHGRVHLSVSQSNALRVNGQPATDGELRPDSSSEASIISCGPLTMVVLQRGDRVGLRLWDNSRAARKTYPGRVWFPANLAWRLEAVFRPHDPPVPITIPNVLGDSTVEAGVGQLAFEHDGRVHRLEALETEAGELWFIFGDRTNGLETYPSGRFLVCAPAEHGRATVDFNRAYNPPCAFTEFATCPLPPPNNLLDLRVEVGERYRPLEDRPG